MFEELLGLPEAESRRILPLLDVDGSGCASLAELRAALTLALPSISIEDCRIAMQLSYRSMVSCFHSALPDMPDLLADDSVHFSKEELVNLLESVEGVNPSEIDRILDFLAGASSYGLSICGFLKGIRLFAPCCLLETLRLQLMAKHRRLADAFRTVPDRRAPLDKASFVSILKEAGASISARETDAIFDLLNVRSTGIVTISELIAMLQCSQPKTQPWRAPEALNRQVEQRVREELAPVQVFVSDLKQRLRRGMAKPQAGKGRMEVSFYGQTGMNRSNSMPTKLGQSFAGETGMMGTRSGDLAASGSRRDRLPLARRTFQRISSTLESVPDNPAAANKLNEIRDNIGGYFDTSTKYMGSQKELTKPLARQVDEYRKVSSMRKRGGVL